MLFFHNQAHPASTSTSSSLVLQGTVAKKTAGQTQQNSVLSQSGNIVFSSALKNQQVLFSTTGQVKTGSGGTATTQAGKIINLVKTKFITVYKRVCFNQQGILYWVINQLDFKPTMRRAVRGWFQLAKDRADKFQRSKFYYRPDFKELPSTLSRCKV